MADIVASAAAHIKHLRGQRYVTDNGITLTYPQMQRAEFLWRAAVRKSGNSQVENIHINSSDMKYSVKTDAYGNPYIEIDEDILKGVPEDKITEVVKEFLKRNFTSITVNGEDIGVNAQSRGEFTNSKYTRFLQRTDIERYNDKLRTANNLDEIFKNQQDVNWETADHPRKDSIIGFERGKTAIKIGDNTYTADVITANRRDGSKIVYDLTNLVDTKINTEAVPRVSLQNANNSGRNQRSVSNNRISQANEIVNTSNKNNPENIRESRKAAPEAAGDSDTSIPERVPLIPEGKNIDYRRMFKQPPEYEIVDTFYRDVKNGRMDGIDNADLPKSQLRKRIREGKQLARAALTSTDEDVLNAAWHHFKSIAEDIAENSYMYTSADADVYYEAKRQLRGHRIYVPDSEKTGELGET